MAFIVEHFVLYNLFSQSATLLVYLYVSLFVNLYIFLSYYFSARTLGRAVDKLLNGSRATSHGQFMFGKQSLSLFQGNKLSNKTEGVISYSF